MANTQEEYEEDWLNYKKNAKFTDEYLQEVPAPECSDCIWDKKEGEYLCTMNCSPKPKGVKRWVYL